MLSIHYLFDDFNDLVSIDANTSTGETLLKAGLLGLVKKITKWIIEKLQK